MTSDTLTFGSMFSGIGGLDKGLERAGMELLFQCEKDRYAQQVLKKHWPEVPCYGDIRKLRTDELPPVDVIAGGPPCQDFSYAGKRKGISGDRGLLSIIYWKQISEIRPKYVIMENVPGILDGGLLSVLTEASLCGYDCEWNTVSAASVGAFHRRDRIFLVAVRRDAADTENTEPKFAERDNRNEHERETPFGYGFGTGGGSDGRDTSEGTERRRGIAAEIQRDIPDTSGGRCVHGQIDLNSTEGGGGKHSLTLSRTVLLPYSESQGRERGGGGTNGSIHNYRRGYLDGTIQEEAMAYAGYLHVRGCSIDGCEEDSGRYHQETIGREDTGKHRNRGHSRHNTLGRIFREPPGISDFWSPSESELGGIINGFSGRIHNYSTWERGVPRLEKGDWQQEDRFRCLGNAVVPQVAEYVGRCVIDFHNRTGGGNL